MDFRPFDFHKHMRMKALQILNMSYNDSKGIIEVGSLYQRPFSLLNPKNFPKKKEKRAKSVSKRQD